MNANLSRRRVIRVTTALIAAQAGGEGISSAFAQGAQSGAGRNDAEKNADKNADRDSSQNGNMPDVTPPEDLMREHGVLNRLLLIYETVMHKFADNERFDASVVTQAAQVVRDFIEDYHERNEEQQIFPRFRKAGQMLTPSMCSISNIKPGGG